MWVQTWVRKIPWKRKQQPTSVFLPGKFHGQRRLAGYSPWGCKELDRLSNWVHTYTYTHTQYYVSRATFNYIYTFENEIFIHKLLFKCINLLKYTHSWIVWIILKTYSLLSVVLQKCISFFWHIHTIYLFIFGCTGLSLVSESGSYSLVMVHQLLNAVASLVVEHGL